MSQDTEVRQWILAPWEVARLELKDLPAEEWEIGGVRDKPEWERRQEMEGEWPTGELELPDSSRISCANAKLTLTLPGGIVVSALCTPSRQRLTE